MSFREHQKVCHFLNTLPNTHSHTHTHSQASILPPSFLSSYSSTSFLPSGLPFSCMFLRCLRLRLLSRLPLRRFHFFARVLLELFSFATTRAGSKLQDGLEAIHVCVCVFHKPIPLQFRQLGECKRA